jgi:hypothetical protein
MAKYGPGKNNIPQAGRFGAQSEVAFAEAVAGGDAFATQDFDKSPGLTEPILAPRQASARFGARTA